MARSQGGNALQHRRLKLANEKPRDIGLDQELIG
jgi:hypothetical protein